MEEVAPIRWSKYPNAMDIFVETAYGTALLLLPARAKREIEETQLSKRQNTGFLSS